MTVVAVLICLVRSNTFGQSQEGLLSLGAFEGRLQCRIWVVIPAIRNNNRASRARCSGPSSLRRRRGIL